MTQQSTAEIVVRRSVEVPLDAARAFELFTTQMTAFWPAEHSIGAAPIAQVVVEPHTDGRWYERGTDDSECPWGRVAVWGPPSHLTLVWQIGADWRYDADLETEVELTFTDTSPISARVDLAHRHLERYGDRAEDMRALFGSPGAWQGILERFTAVTGT